MNQTIISCNEFKLLIIIISFVLTESLENRSSLLFTPITIRNITFKNRIWIAPMQMSSCDNGFITDFYFANLGSFAIGGASMVMIEGTGVEPRGRVSPNDCGVWNDQQIQPLRRIVKLLKSLDCVAGIQLSHSGRKGSATSPWSGRGVSIGADQNGWETIGPSPVPFGKDIWKVPKEATIQDLISIKKNFVSAAKRSVEAGFEVIELHFAHGFLVSTFLCPISNIRKDQYGGSFHNRIRFALEIANSVRRSIPKHIILGIRLSVTDFVDNSWTISDSIELSKQFKKLKIDFIDCSSGGVVSGISYNGLNTDEVQRSAAARIRKEVGIKTIAVGKIVDPKHAENILRANNATLIMIGRAALNNPHWPYHAADVLAADNQIRILGQYEWAIGWKAKNSWRKTVLNKKH